MKHTSRILAATGLAAMVLPFSAAPLPADATTSAAPTYGGYTTEAWATPIRIEVYEPSLPIPATPQLEFELGYSKVKADSGQSSGRASMFWPGDPVGEGLRTFGEQLGLPVDNPLTGPGYPVQVNSQFPGDHTTAKDEPLPGMIQRTTSADKTAIAQNAFSADGAVDGPDGGGTSGGATNPLQGLLDGLNGLLGAPALPGTSGTAGASSGTTKAGMLPGTEGLPSLPGLPAPLAALVDMDGYVSTSQMNAKKDPIAASARAELGEVKLLGGLITLGGVEAFARTTSNGTTGVATGKNTFGKMAIAGQQFDIGPDGITAAGKTTAIPGLPDAPAKALETLGVSFEIPEQTKEVKGDQATSISEGLRVTLNLKVLAPLLSALPTSVLADLIPAEAGPLKGIVAGLGTLSPRIVITLGVAHSTVDTVPPINFDPIAPGNHSTGGQTPNTGSTGGTGKGSVAPASPAGGAPVAGGAPTTGGTGGGGGDLGGFTPAAATSGLPPLTTVPGMLMLGGFIAAGLLGAWMRRLGTAALGAGATCPHGLDSGLPDLRKA